jgi:hypothetical protein
MPLVPTCYEEFCLPSKIPFLSRLKEAAAEILAYRTWDDGTCSDSACMIFLVEPSRKFVRIFQYSAKTQKLVKGTSFN